MGYSIEINGGHFEREVIEKSYSSTVIIDFYATWCGPCQLLKPLLEKLVQEYDFILAKVDIDRNPHLAHQFNIEGVPDVRIARNGEILPGFVGAFSEAQLRDFLSRLNVKSDLDSKIEEIGQAISVQNSSVAKQLLDDLFNNYPKHPKVILAAARFLMKFNKLSEAEQLLKTIPEENREVYLKAQALQTFIQLKQATEIVGENELERLFDRAVQLTLVDDYEGALQLFLEIVQESRKYRNDGARKAMVALFNWLGMEHPLTRRYQQELMLTLY